jgi:hypothetical protein
MNSQHCVPVTKEAHQWMIANKEGGPFESFAGALTRVGWVLYGSGSIEAGNFKRLMATDRKTRQVRVDVEGRLCVGIERHAERHEFDLEVFLGALLELGRLCYKGQRDDLRMNRDWAARYYTQDRLAGMAREIADTPKRQKEALARREAFRVV